MDPPRAPLKGIVGIKSLCIMYYHYVNLFLQLETRHRFLKIELVCYYASVKVSNIAAYQFARYN